MKTSFRPIIVWVAILLLGAAAVVLAAGHLGQATAQEAGAAAGSSAEGPTAGLAPADREAEALRAPEGLISWRVSGAALKPRQNDVSYSVGGGGACTYVTAGDASTVWNTPVSLPQGSTVDTLRMYYYDTSGSNSSAWFTVYDLYGSIVQEWNVSTSGTSGNSFNDSANIDHTIDYSVYNYLLNWRPNGSGSGLQLCGFRIFYSPPPFGAGLLPIIQNNP